MFTIRCHSQNGRLRTFTNTHCNVKPEKKADELFENNQIFCLFENNRVFYLSISEYFMQILKLQRFTSMPVLVSYLALPGEEAMESDKCSLSRVSEDYFLLLVHKCAHRLTCQTLDVHKIGSSIKYIPIH